MSIGGACDDEDGPALLEAPGVMLEQDTGCMRRLNWSCTFAGRSAGDVAERLRAVGVRDTSHLKGLCTFELAAGHVLVVVPGTGRVQLRLDVGIPYGRRREEALRVGRQVIALLGG